MAAALLLGRFTHDLAASFWPLGGVRRAFVLAFAALVIVSLGVAARNILAAMPGGSAAEGPMALALRAVLPLALVATSLGCASVAAAGCSPVCTLIRWGGIPLLAVAALAPIRGRRLASEILLPVAALVLWPHCLCDNAANAWWITRLGASPMCHVWSFTASLVALSALSRPRLASASLIVCVAIVGGSLAFFAGHHFFGWPW